MNPEQSNVSQATSAPFVPPYPNMEVVNQGSITSEQVLSALRKVEDPELHMDVLTLELVYKVKIDGPNLEVWMTLTSVACPFGPMIVNQANEYLKQIPHVGAVNVQVTFDPPWQPSDDLRAMMGLL